MRRSGNVGSKYFNRPVQMLKVLCAPPSLLPRSLSFLLLSSRPLFTYFLPFPQRLQNANELGKGIGQLQAPRRRLKCVSLGYGEKGKRIMEEIKRYSDKGKQRLNQGWERRSRVVRFIIYVLWSGVLLSLFWKRLWWVFSLLLEPGEPSGTTIM